MDLIKPMMMLLRFADSNLPGLGKMYVRCGMLETWVKACGGHQQSIAAVDEFLRSMFKVTRGRKYKPTDADLFVPSIENMEAELGCDIKDDVLQAVEVGIAHVCICTVYARSASINQLICNPLILCLQSRWNMLHTSAHAAAYCLDPEFHGHIKDHEEDGEVMQGLYDVLERMIPDASVRLRARRQWTDYQMKKGVFASSNVDMWDAARTEQPHRWWFEFGKGAKELRTVAMRVLSMPLSASSIERAWSSFEFIHNRRRNRLNISRADTLVSIFTNMQMVRRGAKQAAVGQHADAIPWTWVENAEEEEMPEEELPEDMDVDDPIHLASDDDGSSGSVSLGPLA